MEFGGFGDLSEKTSIKQYFEDPQYFADRSYGEVKTTRFRGDYAVDRGYGNALFVLKDGQRYFAKVLIYIVYIGGK